MKKLALSLWVSAIVSLPALAAEDTAIMHDKVPVNNSWAWAAGGISSNLNDLALFLSAIRNQKLLNGDTQKILLLLNSSKDKGFDFFGGTCGSDGIQVTMLHLMPNDVVIIILINSSGITDVNLSSVFIELFKIASNKK